MRNLISTLFLFSVVATGWWQGGAQTLPPRPSPLPVQPSAQAAIPTAKPKAKPGPAEERPLTDRQRNAVELLREAGDEAGAVKEKFRAALLQAKVADRLFSDSQAGSRRILENLPAELARRAGNDNAKGIYRLK